MSKRIKLQIAPPDDEIYSNGLIVGGTPLAESRKDIALQKAVDQASKEDEQAMYEAFEDDEKYFVYVENIFITIKLRGIKNE